MTAKKPEPKVAMTIPVRGSRKKREPIKRIDPVTPLRNKLKVSHRG